MQNQIIPLGAGGWIPNRNFETACYAFRHGENLFLLDAGSGITRLFDPSDETVAALKEGIRRVFILLSHYHLDHSHGLFYLKGLFPDIPTYLYAPGRGVYKHDAIGMMEKVFAKPISPKNIAEIHGLMEINDLIIGTQQIGGLQISCRLQEKHSDPSIGIRIGDAFSYITDTVPEKETVKFIEGCSVLLHEVWYSSRDKFRALDDDMKWHTDQGHSGNFGATIIARNAGVESLRFIHHNPLLPMTKLQTFAAEASDWVPDTMLARDLLPIDIDLG